MPESTFSRPGEYKEPIKLNIEKPADKMPEVLSHRQRDGSYLIGSAVAHALVAAGFTFFAPEYAIADANMVPVGQQTELKRDSVKHQLEMFENNEQVVEELEKERLRRFDSYIDRYMDSDSPEYEGELETVMLPREEDFFAVDGLNFVISKAEGEVSKSLSAQELQVEAADYAADLKVDYDSRVEKIVNNEDYVWTGDVLRDFSTYQQALYVGPNRFYSNSYRSDTVYQKGHADFDVQMRTGVVNCQVARSGPIVLGDIYEAKGIDASDALSGMKVINWQDHLYSGFIPKSGPDQGQVLTLRDGALAEPIVAGVQPGSAVDPGKVMPPISHLAIYMQESGASPDQIDRMKELGVLNPDLGTFYDGELPDYKMSFLSYEASVDAGSDVNFERLQRFKKFDDRPGSGEGGLVEGVNEIEAWNMRLDPVEYFVKTLGTASEDLENNYLHETIRSSNVIFRRGGDFAIFKPAWVDDDNFIKMFMQSVYNREASDQDQVSFFQTLRLFGRQDAIDGMAAEQAKIIMDRDESIWIAVHTRQYQHELLLELAMDPDFLGRWVAEFDGANWQRKRINEFFPKSLPESAYMSYQRYQQASRFLAQETGDRRYMLLDSSISDLFAQVDRWDYNGIGVFSVEEIDAMTPEELVELGKRAEFANDKHLNGILRRLESYPVQRQQLLRILLSEVNSFPLDKMPALVSIAMTEVRNGSPVGQQFILDLETGLEEIRKSSSGVTYDSLPLMAEWEQQYPELSPVILRHVRMLHQKNRLST